MNRIALTKKQMDTLINAGLDVSDASLIYMGKGQYNLNKNEKYINTIIKCKLGFYTYTLEDIYKRIDDIIALDYFLVITPACIQLQYIKMMIFIMQKLRQMIICQKLHIICYYGY